MSWEISYRASVERDVDRLSTHIRLLALRKIDELAENPFPPGCMKFKGTTERHRFKVARERKQSADFARKAGGLPQSRRRSRIEITFD